MQRTFLPGLTELARIPYSEWELASLFEVEPEYPYPEDPWPYTELVFRVEQGQLALRYTLQPAEKSISIELAAERQTLYSLNMQCARSIVYSKDAAVERLVVEYGDRQTLVIRVRPHISIRHEVTYR